MGKRLTRPYLVSRYLGLVEFGEALKAFFPLGGGRAVTIPEDQLAVGENTTQSDRFTCHPLLPYSQSEDRKMETPQSL